MPSQPSKRRNRPGQGRPATLTDPCRIEFWIEGADRAAIRQLPGDDAVHFRAAVRAYLAREDIAAQLRETRELIAEGQD